VCVCVCERDRESWYSWNSEGIMCMPTVGRNELRMMPYLPLMDGDEAERAYEVRSPISERSSLRRRPMAFDRFGRALPPSSHSAADAAARCCDGSEHGARGF